MHRAAFRLNERAVGLEVTRLRHDRHVSVKTWVCGFLAFSCLLLGAAMGHLCQRRSARKNRLSTLIERMRNKRQRPRQNKRTRAMSGNATLVAPWAALASARERNDYNAQQLPRPSEQQHVCECSRGQGDGK